MKLKTLFRNFLALVLTLLLVTQANLPPTNALEHIRAFTRDIEFDYVTWTLDALFVKNSQAALGTVNDLSDEQQKQVVLYYLAVVDRSNQVKAQIDQIYANPQITDPETQAASLLQEQKELQALLQRLGPLAESILQGQVSATLAKLGLTLMGQPIPPVLYHVTSMPYALIVSPRDRIQQDANISLLPDLSLDQITSLENEVERSQGVSALVVEIGGVGVYPTMVMSTTSLSYLVEVIAHEWTHNYLTLRPLGLNYETSPDLRTMNETTASISGKEVGQAVLAAYYPEYLPKPEPEEQNTQPEQPAEEPPPFNFQSEMHQTRVTVDKLLAQGKITQAESYMEQRRAFFWENGYAIRRLNQAYFAFYGAYADQPGGAAGSDPVGPAVRALRQSSPSLASFINRISWMTSFTQLQQALAP
ncbi:MAG: hypothetical protein GYA59_04615 [Chloroflexi bacterium]|nr:hypothetical protein [Chloroflexota bacterium]